VTSDRLTVRVRGLEAFGHHGVLPAETELGQRFVVDLEVELREPLASRTDELIDTVDYASLSEAVCALVSGPPVALLERLAGMIADLALEEPWAGAVTVTVRKPHVALRQPVEETSVTLRRAASGDPDPLVPLRLLTAALDARDPDALLRLVTEDVEVADERAAVAGRGRDGVLAWLRENERAGVRIERDGAEAVTAGRVVAPVLLRLGDGRELRAAAVVDVRGARVARIAIVADRAAAGL
jgi:dihydroneopterin aldolase